MRITDVDIIPIYPRLVARAAAYNAHFPNWNLRTVFRVKTDNGLVGYGDYRCPDKDRVGMVRLLFSWLCNKPWSIRKVGRELTALGYRAYGKPVVPQAVIPVVMALGGPIVRLKTMFSFCEWPIWKPISSIFHISCVSML